MKRYLITLFLFFLFFSQKGFSQVQIEGQIHANGNNVLLSCYTLGSHQVIPVTENGQFTYTLPRYEECMLVAYGINSLPKTISVNTEASCSETIQLGLTLEQAEDAIPELIAGPNQRYITTGSTFQQLDFDLDDIEDKLAFAKIMSALSKNTKAFYTHRTIPKEYHALASNVPTTAITKTNHEIGQLIYRLLNEKKSLQNQLTKLQSQFHSNRLSPIEQCPVDIALLEKEAAFAKTNLALAKAKLEKEQLAVIQRALNTQQTSNIKVQKARKAVEVMERHNEVANLNILNKRADCAALGVQAELAKQIRNNADSLTIKIKKAALRTQYLRSRSINARQLAKTHNELANQLTGRERWVELANAQKYIAEQEAIKLEVLGNDLSIWNYKHSQHPNYTKQIQEVRAAYNRQHENAWQAEMAYLEHMWHLREKPAVGNYANTIYNRQNDLLTVKLNHRTQNESITNNSSTQAQPTVLDKITINTSIDTRGEVETILLEEDKYEIIVDTQGNKQYHKNGKPITRLTYGFETQRKFGKMLEQVEFEAEKQSLWKFFKEKIKK